MIEHFACPVCWNTDWCEIQRFIFSKSDSELPGPSKLGMATRRFGDLGHIFYYARPRKRIHSKRRLTTGEKRRREILFNLWCPGNEEIELGAVCCNFCGFICYAPRPDESDVQAKYDFLKRTEPNIGGQTFEDALSIYMDKMRAHFIFNLILSQIENKDDLSVLDYGGGNGKLMLPFIDHGSKCFIVDYNPHPIMGVTKIGDDIRNWKTGSLFDVIICSHVLEHVSNLSELITSLRNVLKPNGMIYAEVPHEIWGGLHIDVEPVTHINFFSTHSFSKLFVLHGFDIIVKKRTVGYYGKTPMEVIYLLARRSCKHYAGCGEQFEPEIEEALFPNRLYSLSRFLRIHILSKLLVRLKLVSMTNCC